MAGNANSGRRPTPTALRVLRGNPSRRRLNQREPQLRPADASFDEPPRELDGDDVAQAEWRRVVPMLRHCGLVSEVERASLVTLCQVWSQYTEAHERVRQLGMLIKGSDGPIVNPFFKLRDKLLSQLQRLWVELGLTPSARGRMTALPQPEPKEESKWKGLL